MINSINLESPHVREVEMKNRELRAALEDRQRALELIMSKYREHTQKKLQNSQMNFRDFYNPEKNEVMEKHYTFESFHRNSF